MNKFIESINQSVRWGDAVDFKNYIEAVKDRDEIPVAVALQTRFNNYPTLSRPIYVRTGNFNQQLTPGMMLLEVGSCGNTLEEANRAAELTAKCLAELVKIK